MKKINNSIVGFVAAVIALSGCMKQSDSFENKLFVKADSYRDEVRVATDEGVKTLTRQVVIGVAQPLEKDVHASMVKSSELLDTYREAFYDPQVELLPDENCDITGLELVIRAGDISSNSEDIVFKDLDKLDYSKTYVLPISVSAK